MIKKLKKGFTLVELIVVIAIIAILSTVAVVGYTRVVEKANVSNDTQLVRNLNERMSLYEAETGYKTPDTAHDAFVLTEDFGFIIEKLTPTSSGNDIVWDMTTNRFALIGKTDKKVVYSDPTVELSDDPVDLWKVYKTVEAAANSNYSVYLAGTNLTGVLNAKVGVDVGRNKNIGGINYTNISGGEQKVVIRTNGGSLTVNAPAHTVKHYGEADLVDIKSVDSNASYHEHGEVSLVKISNGRIVVTEKAKIGGIHAVATEDEFNDIKVAVVGNAEVPPITRDAVSEDSKTEAGAYIKFVLEVQTIATEDMVEDSSEYVWISVVVDGEGKATTTTEVATSKTELNETTKIAEGSQSAVAKSIAESTKDAVDSNYVAAKLGAIIFEISNGEQLVAFLSTNEYLKGKVITNVTLSAGVQVSEEKELDLNTKKITINSVSKSRPIQILSSGQLTVSNGDLSNEFAGTYGICDNYGTLYLNNVNAQEGSGDGGAMFRNMTNGKTYVNGGTFNVTSESGNQIFRNNDNSGNTYLEINNASLVSASVTDYPIVIRSGEAVFNGVKVFGSKGAIGIEGGTATINNSDFIDSNAQAGKYYAVYVTDKYSASSVTINGGKFKGGRFDVLVTSPDYDINGSLEKGDITVTINQGNFDGAGVRCDTAHGSSEFQLIVNGGTYNVDPSEYVNPNLYQVVGEGPYTVSAK